MTIAYPDPSDSAAFYNDPAQDDDLGCEHCGKELTLSAYDDKWHCLACTPECFCAEG